MHSHVVSKPCCCRMFLFNLVHPTNLCEILWAFLPADPARRIFTSTVEAEVRKWWRSKSASITKTDLPRLSHTKPEHAWVTWCDLIWCRPTGPICDDAIVWENQSVPMLEVGCCMWWLEKAGIKSRHSRAVCIMVCRCVQYQRYSMVIKDYQSISKIIKVYQSKTGYNILTCFDFLQCNNL